MTDEIIDEPHTPQIYILTPPDFDVNTFPEELAKVLDDHEVACVRMALATQDEHEIGKAADALREVCHARDIAIVIENHVVLAERHGLDGVHLTDGARSVRYVRKELGTDAIVGAFCGGERHAGLNAGEASADYVSFGPVTATALGDGSNAEVDLFKWWSDVVEVPVVAEGALTLEMVKTLAPVADFIALGPEIWSTENPSATLGAFIKELG